MSQQNERAAASTIQYEDATSCKLANSYKEERQCEPACYGAPSWPDTTLCASPAN